MNGNIIANMVGRFWSTLSNFIFLPLYITILGVDNYAVISFSLIVVGLLTVLDLGFSATIAREMARADVSGERRYRVLKVFEKIFLVTILLCGAGGILVAAPFSEHFIHDTTIDRDLVAGCLRLIIIEAGLQLSYRLYTSGMMGLERQVEANVLNVIWGVLRNGAVVLVILVEPSLLAFFSWQLVVTVLMVAVSRSRMEGHVAHWRPSSVPFLDREELIRVRSFAAGMFLIAFVAAVNTQLDRIVLARLLDLRYLGYYTIAVSIGSGMLALAAPFQSAIQPRLTRLFSEGDVGNARFLYLNAATIVSVLIFPLAAVIGFNAENVVFAWTGDLALARSVSPLVPWAVTAYAFLAMQTMTYAVAMANGFTRYHNLTGLLTLLVSVPGYWIAVGRFGAVGAAAIFMALQCVAATLFHILMDRRFLHLGSLQSYLRLFLIPVLTAAGMAWSLVAVLPQPSGSRLLLIGYLGISYALTLMCVFALLTFAFRLRWRLADLLMSR